MTLKEYKQSKENQSCNFCEWFFSLNDEEVVALALSEEIIIG